MKYIKRFLIKLARFLTGYKKVSLKNVRIGSYEDVLVFSKWGLAKIYIYKDGKYIEFSEKFVYKLLNDRSIILAKSNNDGYSFQFLVYNFDNDIENIRERKTFGERALGIELVGMSKREDDIIGIGDALYKITRKDGTYSICDKYLNILFDEVLDYEILYDQYFKSYAMAVMTKDCKISLYNDYDRTCDTTYDYVDSIYSDGKFPLCCIKKNDDNESEYYLMTSCMYEDSYTIYQDIKLDEESMLIRIKYENNYGYVDRKGKRIVEPIYKVMSPIRMGRFFVKDSSGPIYMHSGTKEYARPYRWVLEEFQYRQYGVLTLPLAVVEDWTGTFYIDLEGRRYDMFKPYEREDYGDRFFG